MKTLSQAVAIGVVVLLVGGITFVSQWVSTGVTPPVIDGPIGKDKRETLHFPVTEVQESVVSEMQPAKGWHDFWFKNPSREPAEMVLDTKSCQCSDVEVLLLTPEEEKKYQEALPASVSQVSAAASGVPAFLGAVGGARGKSLGFLNEADRWQAMHEGRKNTVTVPAQGTGLVRLNWVGRDAKPLRLKIEILAGERITLQVPVTLVPALQLDAQAADVGELTAEGKKTATFVCWSATRAKFDLSARAGDCFECVCTPLTVEECQARRASQEVPVLSGYRLTVTAHERLAGKQLPLGPFQREVELTSDALLEPLRLTVSGIVRGEVRLLEEDRINLGAFLAADGERKSVQLVAERPDLELAVDSKYPGFLEVDLNAKGIVDGQKRWQLTVRVPPNRASGRFPRESAVVLKTLDTPPRLVRIPVTGHATAK